LSKYKRLEKVSTMPELGGRERSAMLAALLKVYLRGEEKMQIFADFFLHWLPRELRLLLAPEGFMDLKLLYSTCSQGRSPAYTPQGRHQLCGQYRAQC
jgi:hypothetical protein